MSETATSSSVAFPGALPGASPPAASRGLGAAVHQDLYEPRVDPAVERARLRGEAGKLGVASFVFFFCIIGGLSLWLNGAFSLPLSRSYTAATDPLRGGVEAKADAAGSLGQLWLVWSDGSATPPAYVDHAKVETDDVDAAVRREQVRVRIVPVGSRKVIAEAWAPRPSPEARVTAVRRANGTDPAARAFPHAVRSAKLLWVIPTRGVLFAGALLGLLGVVLPAALIPFYRFWMGYVAAPLGWFNTRLILGVVFFLLFTPFALALAIKRAFTPASDPLGRAPREGSYWKNRAKQRPRDHFEHSF